MEIERKWLISPEKIPYDLEELDSYAIDQAYLSFYPTIRIRRIDYGREYVLTVKTHPAQSDHAGLQREETEIPLTEKEFTSLSARVIGRIIEKTRYLHRTQDGFLEEIDIFHGELSGLAYMEIEFDDAETAEAYPNPLWVEKDVTYDHRYKNSSLAENGMPAFETA